MRRRLLVVGPGGERPEAALAARRLGTRLVAVDGLEAGAAYLADNNVACVLVDDPRPVTAVRHLQQVRADVPVVALGCDGRSTAGVAALQAGAQDYLLGDQLDPDALERAIRHAMDRKRSEVQLAHLSAHDQLTGLVNRSGFARRVAEALERGAAPAVLFVDVDGFRRINDDLGNEGGDETLREAASRMRSAVRPQDVAARVGGDEFAVLCEGVGDQAAALALADRVVRALEQPLVIDGTEVVLRASVGATVAGEATTADELLRQANDAMHEAKSRGGGRAYAGTQSRAAGRSLEVEASLRRAIPGELVAVYQPQVRLSDGEIFGAEALVRWQDPIRGMVSPGEFIPIAEESGLVVDLGRWMLEEACRTALTWPGELKVSVNVSARQVADPGLVDDVRRALEESGLPPERLQLELTESVLIRDIEAGVAVIGDLRALGVLLALDDFGKGYSSLSYLKRFPVDTIKIDRAFVMGLPESREDIAIVSAVLGFAGAMDTAVVAEGVETDEHVAALLELGCEWAQGFHFFKPLAADVFAELLG